MRSKRVPYEEVTAIVQSWPSLRGYVAHIAKTYEIPLTTARGWVREARRRGHLPANAVHPCPTCGGTGVRTFGVAVTR